MQGSAQDRVVASGEAKVDVKRRQGAPRRPAIFVDCALNTLCRIIARSIFANGDVGVRDASDFLCHRMQTVNGEMRNAKVHDDDQQLHAVKPNSVRANVGRQVKWNRQFQLTDVYFPVGRT